MPKNEKKSEKKSDNAYCKYCGNVIKISDIPENHNCPKCEKENSTFIRITDENRRKAKF